MLSPSSSTSDTTKFERLKRSDSEELIGNDAFVRGKRVYIACALVALVVVVAVVCLAVLVHKRSNRAADDTEHTNGGLSLVDVTSGTYDYDTFTPHWVADENYINWNYTHGIVKHNIDTHDNNTLLTNIETFQSGSSTGVLSPDKKWFLFSNNSRNAYRLSTYADYYVKNLRTKQIKKVRTPQSGVGKLRYCTWGRARDALVVVYKCNIYYMPSVGQQRYYQITSQGIPKKILNGIPAYVYEEEITKITHAIEFSSDGKYMSYVVFNSTLVPSYRYPWYGQKAYTTINSITYPKAGYPNPTIRIIVVDLKVVNNEISESRNHLTPPSQITKGDYYYKIMKFTTDNQVFITWINRAQNESISTLHGVTQPEGRIVEHHATPNGWIDKHTVIPNFASDATYYVTLLPRSVSPEEGSFRHLAKVSLKGGLNQVDYLTGGNYTVHDINCWNAKEQVVYYRSTEVSPRNRHVYSHNIVTKEKKCISCGRIKDDDGTECTYYNPSFSTQCSWVNLLCEGPFLPKSYLFGLKSGRKLRPVENSMTREMLKKKDMPHIIYYSVKSDGYDIKVKETRPKHFSPDKKYPVLFHVYNAPNYQQVTSQFGGVNFLTWFNYYFVTSHDVILIEYDAKGAAYYGYRFMYAVYRKLGYYEGRAAMAITQHLQKKPYVQADNIAVWGWSYGGFCAASILSMRRSPINTALSVAPVTDWRYYDSAYSERYMGIPSKYDNLAGYQRSSILSRAENFAGKHFMMIHGTGDYNVHFQNSAQLAAALTDAQVNFQSLFYPDKDHNLSTHSHLYYVIADYLLRQLKGRGLPKGTTFGNS